MSLCIPKETVERFKKAAREGKFDIGKVYDMSPGERRKFFKQFDISKKLRMKINAAFEETKISEQEDSLLELARNLFSSGEKKKAGYKDIIGRIQDLKKTGVLSPKSKDAFLQDFVATKLGAVVTSEEAGEIVKLSDTLEKLSTGKSEFGTETKEYFEAMREMENYLNGITPQSRLRVFSETIGRGTMLLSIKSPALNIESNTIQGVMKAAERRILNGRLGGVNNDYAVKYMKFVNEVFDATGYDLSRMETISLNRKQLGEEVANVEGKGITRAVGRFYRDVVFEKMLSKPDVVFSSIHATDAMNLASTKLAATEGLKGKELQARALEIFKDATSTDPQTTQGLFVKRKAMLDAQISTYTNKGIYSDIGLGIRKIFNIASGDLRAGDQLMPFVKTPANVIGAGIESSGILVPADALLRTIKTAKSIRGGESLKVALGENFAGFGTSLVRAGLGMTAAYILAAAFKPEDFMGEFPTSQKEYELMKLKNAPTNSVRIGGYWWSLDYLGPLGAPMIGFLYARKYGNNLPTRVMRYYEGVGRQSLKIPGFTETYNVYKAISNAKPEKATTEGEMTGWVINTVADYFRSRLVPSIVADIAKATDTVERKIDRSDPLSKIKAGIPGLRQQLPEDYNVFGKTRLGEGWKVILAGARVKTAQTSRLIAELERLDSTGDLPSITDVSKTSSRAKELKKQIGDKRFNEAMRYFGRTFKERLGDLINNPDYRELSDDDKKERINKNKNTAFEMTLVEYGYEKPEK